MAHGAEDCYIDAQLFSVRLSSHLFLQSDFKKIEIEIEIEIENLLIKEGALQCCIYVQLHIMIFLLFTKLRKNMYCDHLTLKNAAHSSTTK